MDKLNKAKLQIGTEEIIKFTIERHRFRLNQGKTCYVWAYNLDINHARKFLSSLNFKTRIRYKFFIVKKLNERGDLKMWQPQIRKQIQFVYNTYDF